MKDDLNIIEQNNKFIVTKNGYPIQLPKNDGASIVTEFDSRQDAERYISILRSLKKNPAYA
jgi:hypothetical protein